MAELSHNELAPRRAVICKLTELGYTPKEVEKQALCGPTARRSALRRFRNLGHFGDAPRCGGPLKHSERDERELERLLVTGKAHTGVEACDMYNESRPSEKQLSQSSVQAILAKYDLPGRAKPRKPSLQTKQRRARQRWALEMKRQMDAGVLDWNAVAFTDESKFRMFGSEGRQYYRKKKNAPLLSHMVKPRKQAGGGSVFAFGAISLWGQSEIGFLPTKRVDGKQVTANAKTIMDWKETILKPAMDEWQESCERPLWVVHDNDKKAWTTANLRLHEKLSLVFIDWPGNSPDMNCIEWVWCQIDRNLRDCRRWPSLPGSLEDLRSRVKTEWDYFPKDLIRQYIKSMPDRINALIEAQGGYTKY